ncbi:MAG: nicotinate-nucleotide diphosphorylase (carboxylating) [Bacteroidetes bacterium GWF2_49_14]|nr:MAG: nicotinate-nucleotide diphosphorylase (carboxylating) [Bacteroidetes bacterium GWF2_49_14]
MSIDLLTRFIENALAEDIGSGDHTTLSCIPEEATGKAFLIAKQDGILAGTRVAGRVFEIFDPGLMVRLQIPDGTRVIPGDKPFIVSGRQRSILQTERLVLNIIQRMSGIATQTALFAEKVRGTNAKILDTRKTTPNMRFLEKEAVRIGGGFNHRIGLYDMILIKDNHIDYAGGIIPAIERATDYLKRKHLDLKIEVEARSLQDVSEIVTQGSVFRILLDNFTPDRISQAVEMIGGRVETEASGGINLMNIREFALAGVDYISVGALTHQISSLDFSLKAIS